MPNIFEIQKHAQVLIEQRRPHYLSQQKWVEYRVVERIWTIHFNAWKKNAEIKETKFLINT